MYKSFAIRHFKLFKEFRIDGFHRINLITGRNNVGKTSLLEALFIHSGAANINLPFTIEAFRGITQFQGGPDLVVSDLFNDFDPDSAIELEGIDQLNVKHTCRIRIVPAPTLVQPADPEIASAGRGKAVEITFVDPLRDEPASARAILEKGQIRLDPPPIPPLYHGFFLTPRAIDHKADAERFSQLVKTVGEEDNFLQALKLLEPSVKGVRLLNHGGVSMIHVDIGLSRFLPLAYVGEGMARLAAIIVAIASSKNGVVFIDEFENGVHHSMLSKIWEATATFADRFNAQLFITTHSAECIRAAYEVMAGRQHAFKVFRLSRESDRAVVAKIFGMEAIEAALKADLELR